MLTRRQAAAGLAAAAFGRALARPEPARAFAASLSDELAAIEARSGGRLGVSVLDTASLARVDHRADERFPLCSTFKILAVAAVLKRADAGREHLDRRIVIRRADLVAYSPVVKDRIGDAMTLADLCAAAMTESDNTAADLILRSLGGPKAVNAYARTLGDATTTPSAMVRDLQALVLGDALTASSRDQLKAWLLGCRTGDRRLRAGLPEDWQCGDKTGSGDNGSTNDVGVLWPPQRPPLIVAAYLTQTAATYDQREAMLADVARAIVAALGS